MRKKILSVFWITNSIIMIMHLINYYFNQGQGNFLESIAIFLFRNFLPYFNFLLTVICVAALIITDKKAKFVFEREFKYLIMFLVISISTSDVQKLSDPDFIFYMGSVVPFALVLSFLPVEEEVSE